ncbi:MAG: hypothetical protein ACRDIC_01410 [bacterium]
MSDNLRSILEEIRERHGALSPPIVLEEARDPAHPLHAFAAFKWDDDRAAAEAYRLEIAADLIRKVRVTYTKPDGSVGDTRYYRGLPTNPLMAYDYEPIEDLLLDPMKRRILVASMQRQINELVATYEHIQEFWAEIRKLARRRRADRGVS